jgi:CBS domain-containing protein
MKAVVKDVMSTHPISVPETTAVKQLAAMLRESGVSGFPVLDRDGRVLGVVSEADLLAKETLAGGPEGSTGLVHRSELRKAAGTTAADLMTSPAVTVTGNDTISRAARLMYVRGLKRLPVVDAAGRLAGMISRTDVLAVYDRLDEEIRVEIISQVIPRLSEPGWYSVIVKDGVMTVEGTPETPETPAIGWDVRTGARSVAAW